MNKFLIIFLSPLMIFSQDNQEIYGCIDETACNYDPLANIDDDSCLYNDNCCESLTPECLACQACMTVEEWCLYNLNEGCENNNYCEEEDFDGLVDGTLVSTTNLFDTWSGDSDGSAEVSGGEIIINPADDIITTTPVFNSGFYHISFEMGIAIGGSGYFNLSNSGDPTDWQWETEVYFNNDGTGYSTQPPDELGGYIFWDYEFGVVNVSIFVDLDNSKALLQINDNCVVTWDWTGMLGGVGFFGATADTYTIDKFVFCSVDNDIYGILGSLLNDDQIGSCNFPGCIDSSAINYNSTATIDDGTCIYTVLGCTDSSATNYSNVATDDDGSCAYVVYGCTDNAAGNFDPAADTDDGSCAYGPWDVPNTDCNMTILLPVDLDVTVEGETVTEAWIGVLDSDGLVGGSVFWTSGTTTSITVWGSEAGEVYGFDAGETITWIVDWNGEEIVGNTTFSFGDGTYSCNGLSQIISFSDNNINSVYGCTDPEACNYNSLAIEDNDSCVFEEWSIVGESNFMDFASDVAIYTDVNISPDGIPYVAGSGRSAGETFIDTDYADLQIFRYNNQWEFIGDNYFNLDGYDFDPVISFDLNGVLHLAYQHFFIDPIGNPNAEIRIAKYDNNSWFEHSIIDDIPWNGGTAGKINFMINDSGVLFLSYTYVDPPNFTTWEHKLYMYSQDTEIWNEILSVETTADSGFKKHHFDFDLNGDLYFTYLYTDDTSSSSSIKLKKYLVSEGLWEDTQTLSIVGDSFCDSCPIQTIFDFHIGNDNKFYFLTRVVNGGIATLYEFNTLNNDFSNLYQTQYFNTSTEMWNDSSIGSGEIEVVDDKIYVAFFSGASGYQIYIDAVNILSTEIVVDHQYIGEDGDFSDGGEGVSLIERNGVLYCSYKGLGTIEVVRSCDSSLNGVSINCGDVNLDDEVNSQDAALILQFIVGLIDLEEEQIQNGDVNNDDSLNSQDAALILQYIVGLIDEFPGCE